MKADLPPFLGFTVHIHFKGTAPYATYFWYDEFDDEEIGMQSGLVEIVNKAEKYGATLPSPTPSFSDLRTPTSGFEAGFQPSPGQASDVTIGVELALPCPFSAHELPPASISPLHVTLPNSFLHFSCHLHSP